MATIKRKYLLWTGCVGISCMLLYLFQDLLYKKFWLLPFMLLLALTVVFVALLIACFMKRVKYTAYVLVAAVLVLVVTELYRSELFRSRKVLEASVSADLSGFRLVLREDHSFQLYAPRFWGYHTLEGRYKLEGNKIILLDKPYYTDHVADTLLIAHNKLYNYYFEGGKVSLSDYYFTIDLNKLGTRP